MYIKSYSITYKYVHQSIVISFFTHVSLVQTTILYFSCCLLFSTPFRVYYRVGVEIRCGQIRPPTHSSSYITTLVFWDSDLIPMWSTHLRVASVWATCQHGDKMTAPSKNGRQWWRAEERWPISDKSLVLTPELSERVRPSVSQHRESVSPWSGVTNKGWSDTRHSQELWKEIKTLNNLCISVCERHFEREREMKKQEEELKSKSFFAAALNLKSVQWKT